MIKINITPQSGGAVFKNNWRKCVGTGRLGLALQKEYLDALELVQERIGFSYIRGHGLFCDDIGIYREDEVGGESKPFYNFTYIDRIFDSYLERGIKPLVELGFMPSKLASGSNAVFYWKGNVTPPKDYGKWAALVKAAVRHFISRYGMDEVLTWPFEVWNEPNLPGFWKDADKQEYFKLYKVTATAIKEVDNRLQVGGPAICGGADHWIVDFLEFCHKEKVPVDFVSRHAYTSSQPVSATPHFIYQEIWDSDYMINELKSVREIIAKSPFPGLPFYITEYNTSWHPLNPIHDTVFNASYLARIISEAGDYADIFSYWTFSDVFEEQDVPRAQFHGGFGLVALNNIPKPTFHTFSFFARMGEDLLHRDRNIMVTRRKDGSIAIVAWNPVGVKEPDRVLEFEVSIPFGHEEIFMKRQIVNEEYANPLKTWMQMGRPRYPDKGMIKTLRQAAEPLLVTKRLDAPGGEVKLKIALSRNEVTLIELFAVNDETKSYIGLDDSHIGY
ncbi:MAG: GH39 family glycosyl hydrolase [Bacillota bacterium]